MKSTPALNPLFSDPLRSVRDALDRHGCLPQGPEHKFRARCPAHDSNTPSLSVCEGADGRVVVHCFVGCDAQAVVGALGLEWRDLFPPGHRSAPALPGVLHRPPSALDLVLAALRALEIGYRATRDPEMWAAEHCPACGAGETFPLWIREEGGRVALSCMHGCEQVAVLRALAGGPEVSE